MNEDSLIRLLVGLNYNQRFLLTQILTITCKHNRRNCFLHYLWSTTPQKPSNPVEVRSIFHNCSRFTAQTLRRSLSSHIDRAQVDAYSARTLMALTALGTDSLWRWLWKLKNHHVRLFLPECAAPYSSGMLMKANLFYISSYVPVYLYLDGGGQAPGACVSLSPQQEKWFAVWSMMLDASSFFLSIFFALVLTNAHKSTFCQVHHRFEAVDGFDTTTTTHHSQPHSQLNAYLYIAYSGHRQHKRTV